MTTTRALTAAVGALACLFAGSVAHAQGVTKTNILIGQSSPFSGSNKELGDDIREGLQAYFKRTNEAGGVNGRTLELIALDDANDAKRSGENARILIEQRGVLALIGYASATLSLPALPFVVIATTLYKTTGDFIKSARKAGSGAQFASISFVGASALAGELGEQGMGVVVSQVVPPYTRNSIPIVREYQAAIEKSLGKKEYSFTSLESYIGAKVLVEAIRRAGANPTREGLLKTLDSIQNFNVGGYLVDFSPSNHNGSRFVELTAIGKSGRFAY